MNNKIKQNTPGSIIAKIVMNIIAISISISCIYPIIWLIYSSFKTKGEFMTNTLALPTILHFENYARAFHLGNLVTSTFNSTFYVITNVVLVTIVATISGYFLARYDFKGKKFIYYSYLIGFLVPIYALLVPVFLQFRLLGLINTRISLIFPYFAMQVTLSTFLVESFIRGIPRSLDEAAAIEGCSVGQTLLKIIFPLSSPAIATIVILISLQTWNEFGFSAVLIRDVSLRTVSVAIQSFRAGLQLEYTYMMAALVSVSIPIITLYLVFSKYIISGITSTGIKE